MKPYLRITVETLLRQGRGQREIERLTGVDRKTIRRLERTVREGAEAKSPGVATGSGSSDCGAEAGENPPPRPPAQPPKQARSARSGYRRVNRDTPPHRGRLVHGRITTPDQGGKLVRRKAAAHRIVSFRCACVRV